jgi:hypothetical protein
MTFQMQNSRKVSNYGWITGANCCQRRKMFMLHFTAKSFNHQLQMLVKLRVKEVRYMFHVFLTSTIHHCEFHGVYASVTIKMVPMITLIIMLSL